MEERWEAIAALGDSGRRALFEYVRRAEHPVSREEAADALDISRGLAAFHLDKLVDSGLLSTRYEAPADVPRGRGRTPKVYEPAVGEIVFSVPEREYALLAQILADAIAENSSDAAAAAHRRARRAGEALGRQQRDAGLMAALTATGYCPHETEGRIALTNCPFHALAAQQTALVCGLNVDLVAGLIKGVGEASGHAHLDPVPGRCCVAITR